MQRCLIYLCAAIGVTVRMCAAQAEPMTQGTANVAIRADILGSEPGVKRDAVTDNVLHHVVEALVTYDGDIALQPMLAKNWEVSEDGTRYSFTLREGVTFHNGEPMTSADVKWSWERWLDPQTGFACLDWYDGSEGFKIDSIETPDPRTVVFRNNRPNPLFLSQIANFQCITAIVHPDSVRNGAWDKPIGTGPFVFGDWNRGEGLTLERFDGYTPAPGKMSGYAGDRTAHVDAVRFTIVPETASALAALRAGDIDLVYQLQPTDRAELQDVPGVKLHEGPNLEWNVLLVQTGDALLSDIRMRRAIAHAIDFDMLAETGSYGISPYNPSTLPASSPYHSDVHKTGHVRDLERARALLAEAGYDGQPIKIQTNRRYNNMYENAVIAQAMMQEAGFNVELDVLEWPAHLDNYFSGAFQLSVFGYSARTEPVLNYQAMLGDKTGNPAYQWDSTEAIGLLEQAARSTDAAERQTLFDRVHALLLADIPTFNLFNHFSIDATSARLKGYSVWPAGKPRLWGVRIEE